MQWLMDIGLALLSGYLAFTGSLATFIMGEEMAPEPVPEAYFSPLPSQYEGSTIPTILLQNPLLQSASVIGSQVFKEAPSTISEATVNVFCTLKTETGVRTATGSGFFISPQGAILTNAHVAQFLLLENSAEYEAASCVIRTGSPAAAAYRAKLLYVPPAWVQANAADINTKNPTGTGERDYALLFVYEAVDDAPLPATFPYLALNTNELSMRDVDTTIKAAGYPAAPLYENGANAPLPQVVAESSIGTIFTFTERNGDVISMPISPVSATGASGGPVTNSSGEAIGVIATRSDDPKDSLRALSVDYINRTIKEETGLTLLDYLRGDLAVRSRIFNDALTPFLTQLLEFELE